jgi:RNA polymerase sigma-70 factor (family 1)
MNTNTAFPSQANDLDILEMIRKDDDRAFELLYKRYWAALLHFAGRYLDDTDSCEEIVQKLFVQLLQRRSELKIRSSVSSYLYVALRNKIFNYLRDRAVYRKHVITATRKATFAQNNVQQFIDLKELQEEISLSLGQMPPKCREVYELREQHHLTVKKISEILKRPADTVEKQLRKANDVLRTHLKENKMTLEMELSPY